MLAALILRVQVLLLVFAALAPTFAATPDSILLIGNSFSDGNISGTGNLGVDSNLNQLSIHGGIQAFIRDHFIGGQNLSGHNADTWLSSRISGGHWSTLVLQGQSSEPLDNYANFRSGAMGLKAKADAIGAETLLFMTWCYRDKTDGAMTQKLADAYNALGKEMGARVIPVGIAWQKALDQTNITLYRDVEHAHIPGTYLASCVIYATLFGISPVGNTYLPPLMNQKDANTLQSIAWSVVDSIFNHSTHSRIVQRRRMTPMSNRPEIVVGQPMPGHGTAVFRVNGQRSMGTQPAIRKPDVPANIFIVLKSPAKADL